MKFRRFICWAWGHKWDEWYPDFCLRCKANRDCYFGGSVS